MKVKPLRFNEFKTNFGNLLKPYSLRIITDVIGVTGDFGRFGTKFNGLTGPKKDQKDQKGQLM